MRVGASEARRRCSMTLELQLKAVVSYPEWVLGTKLSSWLRAGGHLHQRALSGFGNLMFDLNVHLRLASRHAVACRRGRYFLF